MRCVRPRPRPPTLSPAEERGSLRGSDDPAGNRTPSASPSLPPGRGGWGVREAARSAHVSVQSPCRGARSTGECGVVAHGGAPYWLPCGAPPARLLDGNEDGVKAAWRPEGNEDGAPPCATTLYHLPQSPYRSQTEPLPAKRALPESCNCATLWYIQPPVPPTRHGLESYGTRNAFPLA